MIIHRWLRRPVPGPWWACMCSSPRWSRHRTSTRSTSRISRAHCVSCGRASSGGVGCCWCAWASVPTLLPVCVRRLVPLRCGRTKKRAMPSPTRATAVCAHGRRRVGCRSGNRPTAASYGASSPVTGGRTTGPVPCAHRLPTRRRVLRRYRGPYTMTSQRLTSGLCRQHLPLVWSAPHTG